MSQTDRKMKELIVAARLSHQHRCAGCGVLLEAFGRSEEPGKWSCEKCAVLGATVASVEDPKGRS
jgi:ribosomal protein L37AE/L43A